MMGRDGSGNTLAPNSRLKINLLLQNFPPNKREEEYTQATFVVLKYMSTLRQVYNFYCTIGHNRVQNTKSDMTRLQFWRFIKDSHIHHHKLSLPEMDRIIAPCLEKRSFHQPVERFSFSDFSSSITILAYAIFKDKIILNNKKPNGEKDKQRPDGAQGGKASQRPRLTVLSNCLEMLINEHIKKHSGRVKGGFLFEPRRYINALAYMESSWKIYWSICDHSSKEPTLIMRKLLHALNDLQIIGPRLPSEKFLKILASDHPRVYQDEVYNLEIEICFLEYFEALIACAVSFVDEDLMKQEYNQPPPPGPKPARRIRKVGTSAGRGIGHSRPGSSYSRRTSARSLKSASSKTSSISSIEEDDSSEEDGSSSISEASTVQKEVQGASQDVDESMKTVVGSLEELDISDEAAQQISDQRASPDSIDMSAMFAEMEEDEKIVEASPRSRRRTPEVMTAEMEKREKEFLIWSTKLQIFFTKYLIPAWRRIDLVRRETARHRNKRLAS